MTANNLRVVHIAKYYPPDPGGMEYFVRDLAREQARAGHEVLVLAHAGQTGPGVTLDAPNLTVKRFGVWTVIGGYAPVSPGLLRAICGVGRDFKPDLVHLHCPNPAGAALWPLPPSPLVLHWHSDVVFPPERAPARWLLAGWRRLEKGLMSRAAGIIATSPHYAETSPELKNYLDKVRVVPLGLPETGPGDGEFSSGSALDWLAAKPEGSRLLTIGRLSHYKGLSVLLKALVNLPRAFLCIIGRGEEKARLEAECGRLGLGPRVFFAGQIDDAEKERCLALADVFCLPSLDRTEAFGLVLLEAMRSGTACLAASVRGSGMSYALDGGRTGVLVEPGRAEALAEAVSGLLADRERRSRLAEAGRRRFLNNFTMPVVAAKTEEIYKEILSPGR